MADPSHLPPFAAWRHHDARSGFEVAFFDGRTGRLRVEGHTAAVEDGEAYAVRYAIELDEAWKTLVARVSGQSPRGSHAVVLEGDGMGGWRVDGASAPRLVGCLDVDLESSALTNAFPVARLALDPGECAEAPAVYVRTRDLTVDRLEQRYARRGEGSEQRYGYHAPAFDFECELVYDDAGLLLEYPGIASRVAAR
jgi:hypothetical protein